MLFENFLSEVRVIGSNYARIMSVQNTTMKLAKLLIAALSCLSFSACIAEEKPDANGFNALFDGKTSIGWHNPYKWGEVNIVDGEIHLTGDKKFFLVTDKQYADFIFESDVHLPKGKANSGFMFRAHVEPNKVFGYQAEVDGDSKRGWSGGLYDESRRLWFISPIRGDKANEAAFRKRAGDTFQRDTWNTYRITCKGKHITIEVNGVITTDVEDTKDLSGYIAIQHHGEKGQTYRFRNLRIKELK